MILIKWIDIKKAMSKYPDASFDDILTHAYTFAKTRYWEEFFSKNE